MAAGVARLSGALARRAGRHALAAGLGLAVLAAPGPAPAQGLWTFTPSLQVAEEYTDNVFGTAHDRQSDFITQITPGIALLYDARTLKLGLDYSATLELYADNSNLDNFGENQRGSVRFEYRPEERLGFHLTGYYARTNDPSTFLVPTTAPPPGATVVPTVETTRSETTQVTINAGADYHFTPRLTGRAGYDFSFLQQEGTDDGYTHTGTVGANYQLSRQDDAFTTLSGSVLDSTDTDTSATLLLGWRRRWTELFTTSIALGPRVTDGSWGGAADASAVYQAGRQWSFDARLLPRDRPRRRHHGRPERLGPLTGRSRTRRRGTSNSPPTAAGPGRGPSTGTPARRRTPTARGSRPPTSSRPGSR